MMYAKAMLRLLDRAVGLLKCRVWNVNSGEAAFREIVEEYKKSVDGWKEAIDREYMRVDERANLIGRLDAALYLLHTAVVVISNAHGGDFDKAPADWREAARELLHRTMRYILTPKGDAIEPVNAIQDSYVAFLDRWGVEHEETLTTTTNAKQYPAPQPAAEPFGDEKRRRIYYQDIVYYVCAAIDRYNAARTPGPHLHLRPGTVDNPTGEVQAAIDELLEGLNMQKPAADEQSKILDRLNEAESLLSRAMGLTTFGMAYWINGEAPANIVRDYEAYKQRWSLAGEGVAQPPIDKTIYPSDIPARGRTEDAAVMDEQASWPENTKGKTLAEVLDAEDLKKQIARLENEKAGAAEALDTQTKNVEHLSSVITRLEREAMDMTAKLQCSHASEQGLIIERDELEKRLASALAERELILKRKDEIIAERDALKRSPDPAADAEIEKAKEAEQQRELAHMKDQINAMSERLKKAEHEARGWKQTATDFEVARQEAEQQAREWQGTVRNFERDRVEALDGKLIAEKQIKLERAWKVSYENCLKSALELVAAHLRPAVNWNNSASDAIVQLECIIRNALSKKAPPAEDPPKNPAPPAEDPPKNPAPPAEPFCMRCFWFTEDDLVTPEHESEKLDGACELNPPIPILVDGRLHYHLPGVWTTDRCSHFTPKKSG